LDQAIGLRADYHPGFHCTYSPDAYEVHVNDSGVVTQLSLSALPFSPFSERSHTLSPCHTHTMSNQITSNPTSQTVAQLLPKLHDVDPDYRFMSLNDLFTVLSIGKPDFLHNDYNTAARAVDGILKTLDDQNGEVQNLAIKWYSSLCFFLIT
jgi:hypothetical protein